MPILFIVLYGRIAEVSHTNYFLHRRVTVIQRARAGVGTLSGLNLVARL